MLCFLRKCSLACLALAPSNLESIANVLLCALASFLLLNCVWFP
uniref:Uncharacterized protein n=1 Tax=Arundo donax TaxID=35708 RepID=A0A0A9CHI8_ARUDO